MKIRREDLMAAAAAGLLQRRQIGPLFLFLLQRDVRAKRMALAAQARLSQHYGVYRMLFYMAGFTAVATTVLFAVLLTTSHSTGVGALFLFAMLYMSCAWGLVQWFRKQSYGRRIRTLPALILATLPLAVIAAQQVAV